MKRVEIYTTPTCPYCIGAKALLTQKGVAFDEIDVSAGREDMIARAGGRRTVPQIFVGDTHVGGFDDLRALDATGGFDRLVAE